MEQTNRNQFKCSGNCLNCAPAQRAYCASQHAYSNMKVLDKMMETIMSIQDEINEIKGKIESMQNDDDGIFDPNVSDDEVNSEIPNYLTAQSGDGADE